MNIIAQDFYLLYQRHKKNQTVKITVLVYPSINILIHVSKNRGTYIDNNLEATAKINIKQLL